MRKRSSNVASYGEHDGPVYYNQWPEDSIDRQLNYTVPQAIYLDSQGNAIPSWRAGWCHPYAWPDNDVPVYLERFVVTEETQHPVSHSGQHQQESHVEGYAYDEQPVYYSQPAEEELRGEYETEVGYNGVMYSSPRQEHVASHPPPSTAEIVQVSGTTYYSPHQEHSTPHLHPRPSTPAAEVGGTTYYSPYPSPPASKEGEPVRGYIEGYHEPKLKLMTRDWWRLFGATTGEMLVLNSVKAERAAQAEATHQSEAREGGEMGEEKEEWSAAKYFAPYRGSGEEACAGCEAERMERADRPLEISNCALAGRASEQVKMAVPVKECKGRDDWECDYCGVECFCCTVGCD
jgi:hypothetical protein